MQKLFAITSQGATQPVEILSGVSKEAKLRDIAAGNLKTLFGIHFFAKEYKIKDRQADPVSIKRIDTVGISEDNCPVLFEYKKGKDSRVVTQILSYYYMFQDEEANFRLQVSQDPELGMNIANKLDFNGIRLICLAREFTRDDLIAWRANDFIELVTYRYFDNNTLLLEWIKGNPPQPPVGEKKTLPKIITPSPAPRPAPNIKSVHRTLQYLINQCDSSTRDLYNKLSQEITDFGTDISQYTTSRLNNFKRRQRFACFRPVPTENKVLVWLDLDPKKEKITKGFTRDVSGTATDAGNLNLEVSIGNQSQFKKALDLCRRAYRKQKASSSKSSSEPSQTRAKYGISDILSNCDEELKKLFNDCRKAIFDFGDVTHEYTKALLKCSKNGKVFACLRPYPGLGKVQIWASLNPKDVKLREEFTLDHTYASGKRWASRHCNLRITTGRQDLQEALNLCRKAYNQVSP